MNVRFATPIIFAVALLCAAAVSLAPDSADARPSLEIPELEAPQLESNLKVASDGYLQQSGDNGETTVTGVGANRKKMLIRLGLGIGAQTGFGSGAGRLDINLIGVFEMDNLRFFGQGGYLAGSEASGPAGSNLYATGWFLGGGAGYKVTIVGPDIAGLYGQAGGFFQSISGCNSFASDNSCADVESENGPGAALDVELGGFLHNGNSQVHLGATASLSTILGFTAGATLRWEYRLFGFAR